MTYDIYKYHQDIDKKLNDNNVKCNFHIAKFSKINNPKFIAITCLFKLRKSYKSFALYLNTLKASCRVNEHKPIIIRIYYDTSVANEIKQFNLYKNVELIKYEFPQFFKNGTHFGTFGTFMRTLCFFNFAANKNINHCFDADMHLDYDAVLKCITAMKKTNSHFYALFYDCLNTHDYLTRAGTNVFGDIVLATNIINSQKLKLSYEIFVNFIKIILNPNIAMKDWLAKNTEYNRINNMSRDFDVVPYGLDEYFINSFVLPVIHQNTNVIGTRLYMIVRDLHYAAYQQLLSDNSNQNKEILLDLQTIFKNYIEDMQNDVQKLIQQIDDLVYKKIDIFHSLNNHIDLCKQYMDLHIKWMNNGIIQYTPKLTKCLKYNAEARCLIDGIYILHKKFDSSGGGNANKINKKILVVPYADFYPEQNRSKQLRQFLDHMTKLGNKTQILIAEQIKPKTFNKGQLYNAAIKWIIDHNNVIDVVDTNAIDANTIDANTIDASDNIIIILHDVDILPNKRLFERYTSDKLDTPVMLLPTTKYFKSVYTDIIPIGGAVTAIKLSDYIKINGFPNNFWNWGGEDNAFQKRLKQHSIWYHYNNVGDFKTIDKQRTDIHSKDKYIDASGLRNKNALQLLNNDTGEGLKEIQSNVVSEISKDNITHIKIELPDHQIYGMKSTMHNANKITKKQNAKMSDRTTLIVVPYGNLNPEEHRNKQLQQFVQHMKQLIISVQNMFILIAEQVSPSKYFNRGQLLNAGIKWYCQNYEEPNIVIFHDVDMLPDRELFNQYLNVNQPTSLVPFNDDFKKMYGNMRLIGGAIYAIPFREFVKINGYPNTFWGWGGEDNALSNRMKKYKLTSIGVKNGTYTSTDVQRTTHASKMDYLRKNKIRSMMVHENLAIDANNWKLNGYSNLNIDVCNVITIGKQITQVQFQLSEDNLQNTINHNEQIYREISKK